MSRQELTKNQLQVGQETILLRDALVWLLQRRDWGVKKWRMQRLLERLERFPTPTGLVRELDQLIPEAPPRKSSGPVRVAAGNKLAATEFAVKTVELLNALARTMADSSLVDSDLQNSLRAFGEAIPKRVITSDLRRLLADTPSIDAASRRARRREYQRRQEVSKIITALAKAIDETSTRSQNLADGLEDIVQTLWDAPDVEGLRSLRKQVSSSVRSLASDARTLRTDLEGARTRASSLENLVAEQAERIVDLQAEASQDPLTGVPNRRTFDHWLPKQVKSCLSTDAPFALVILDLDHFKQVNDTWGHPFGDTVLQAAAQSISAAIRQDDIVARIGGEEFAVLIRGAVPNVARVVAERLRASVQNLDMRPEPDADPVSLTASAGMANLRPDDDAETLYARADKGLYTAKANGRDRLVDDWFDE